MTNWVVENLNTLARQIGHWRARKGFETNWSNIPEKLMLIVTECTEAMEIYRDIDSDYPDSETGFGEEIADIIIRALDLMDSLGLDTEMHMKRKMDINEKRPFRHGRQR